MQAFIDVLLDLLLLNDTMKHKNKTYDNISTLVPNVAKKEFYRIN